MEEVEDRSGDGADISAPRARQAYPGRRILWILSISLVLVVSALFGAVALFSGPLASSNHPRADAAAVRGFDGPVVQMP